MIYLDASNENSYSGSGSNWYDLTSNGNDGVISGTTFSNDGGGSFEFGSSVTMSKLVMIHHSIWIIIK